MIKVNTDNQSSLHFSKNPIHDRIKHVDMKFHFVRNMVEKGLTSLVKIPMGFNTFDLGTKILPLNNFKNYLKILDITWKVVNLEYKAVSSLNVF